MTTAKVELTRNTMVGGMIVSALLVGYLAGRHEGRRDRPLAAVPPAALPDPHVERYRVPLDDSPSKGSDEAKVTIVEFSDFQCPYCSGVERTVREIERIYGNDVRVVWKNNPLPFHEYALPAAKLAMAAAQHGQFWELQPRLFKHQQTLDRASLERDGRAIGLDATTIAEALDGRAYVADIARDQREAARLGAIGAPAFFINGRPLLGAQPLMVFTRIIDEELGAAQRAIRAGVAPSQVYEALTRGAREAAPALDHVHRERS